MAREATDLEKLEEIQGRIDKAKRDQALCEGAIQQLQETLKKEFGITEKDIPKLIKKLETEKAELEEEINTGLTKLQKDYNWSN